ncbi:MFS transporter [Pullulanibacillus sp. KACC 23026]|uniref:MFS transporter n=1 Tax=Pullulanibacillus sp. KACC 23026 TaxID=3028315 RepID=UPI0023AF2965|nr:MFS transporter [Pullulanibacillus sp. KACC 23026]WEG12827.1 MFS transporter [Pullulanibacillus sp. KACC 23026]
MNKKWIMLLLIWLMMFVAYLDRINISVAGPTIQKELHISPAGFGVVLSAFTFGYAILQIPGGILADKFGAKRLLVIALIWWSIFTGMTGMAMSLGFLIVSRVLFGVGEGLENGAQFKLVGDFFPSHERSSANGLFLTSLALGPAVVAPVAAWLLKSVGWHSMFYLFIIPGLIMAILIGWFIPNKPTEGVVHTEITNRKGLRASWSDIMAHPAIWLAFVAYLFFNIAFWGFLGWMPSYLSEARHITLSQLGMDASLPYWFGFLGLVIVGFLGNRFLNRYRASMIAISYLLAGLCLYISFSAKTVSGSLFGLSAAAFFLYGGFGPFWSVALDLLPDQLRGTFSGFVNFGGQIGGFIAPIIIGGIVSATDSFNFGFGFMIAAVILSAIALFCLQAFWLKVQSSKPANNSAVS